MRSLLIVLLLTGAFIDGCARTWPYQELESFQPASDVPPAAVCKTCHAEQFVTWSRTRHGEASRMERISVAGLRECGACHGDLSAHAADPAAAKPAPIGAMTKSEKNMLCGKCHYNQRLFGSRAINPHDKHALFSNVALEGQNKQIACLDCHSGHKGGSDMLVRIKAHICYECHTSAMFTMAIFQPFNYLTFGKMCQACHTVHGGSPGERWGRMGVGFCIICHFTGVALVD